MEESHRENLKRTAREVAKRIGYARQFIDTPEVLYESAEAASLERYTSASGRWIAPYWNAAADRLRTGQYKGVLDEVQQRKPAVESLKEALDWTERVWHSIHNVLTIINTEAQNHGAQTTLAESLDPITRSIDPSTWSWHAGAAYFEGSPESPPPLEKWTFMLYGGKDFEQVYPIKPARNKGYTSFKGSDTWESLRNRLQMRLKLDEQYVDRARSMYELPKMQLDILTQVLSEYHTLGWVFDWDDLMNMPFSPEAYAIVQKALQILEDNGRNDITSRDSLLKAVAATGEHGSRPTVRKALVAVGLYTKGRSGGAQMLLSAMVERWKRYAELHFDAYMAS